MVELTSRATRRLRGRPRDREVRAGAAPRRRRGKRREAEETLEPGGVGGSGGAEAREGMGHRRVGARADSQCVAVSLCVRAHARCYFFAVQNVDMCVKKKVPRWNKIGTSTMFEWSFAQNHEYISLGSPLDFCIKSD